MVNLQEHFNNISNFLLNEILQDEAISVNYNGEASYFMRFAKSLVRQDGFVDQAEVAIKLFKKNKSFSFQVGLSGDLPSDYEACAQALELARTKLLLLPEDPYFTLPASKETSITKFSGKLLDANEIPTTVLSPFKSLVYNGLYAQGKIARGNVTSSGAKHWFETETFILDYSLWLENGKAVKSSYAGQKWSESEYAKKVQQALSSLPALNQEPKVLEPGAYKVYLTPSAVQELADFFGGFGAKSLNDGSSSFIALKEGRKNFSTELNLTQDFTTGLEPCFNSEGELAPKTLPIIEKGKLKNILVSTRSAKQYKLKANGASDSEWTRAISILGGKLSEKNALSDLGTGIYISNLYYLNWSDKAVARITGMTRHDCMWVENGKMVCPIANMRWDESLYNIFGSQLLGLTKETKLFPNTSTYGNRSVGGASVPGALVAKFNCTL